MGLDMYFMNGNEEIYYYREHADLNGLLEKIWYETTEIPSVNFNCSSLKITNDILEKIEAEADKKVHKKGHRFFSGVNLLKKNGLIQKIILSLYLKNI